MKQESQNSSLGQECWKRSYTRLHALRHLKQDHAQHILYIPPTLNVVRCRKVTKFYSFSVKIDRWAKRRVTHKSTYY
jgi:hypothetical protein